MNTRAATETASISQSCWAGIVPAARWLRTVLKKFLTNKPVALLVVIGGIVAISGLLVFLGGGLLKCVLIGAIISLVILIRRVSSPHVAFLGRRRYSDLVRHADNESTPGVIPFRVESGIVYFNAEHVFDTVTEWIDTAIEPVRLVVCDLSTSPTMDIAGARMVGNLYKELARRGIAFRIVEARASVRDMLRVEGVEEKIGRVDHFTSLAAAIEDFHNQPQN